MSETIRLTVEAVWYFLPALMANLAPGIAANKLHLWLMHTPVSEKIFGARKTLGTYYVAPAVSIVTIYLQ